MVSGQTHRGLELWLGKERGTSPKGAEKQGRLRSGSAAGLPAPMCKGGAEAGERGPRSCPNRLLPRRPAHPLLPRVRWCRVRPKSRPLPPTPEGRGGLPALPGPTRALDPRPRALLRRAGRGGRSRTGDGATGVSAAAATPPTQPAAAATRRPGAVPAHGPRLPAPGGRAPAYLAPSGW